MRFSTRLLVCFVAPATVFTAATGVGIWGLYQTQADFDRYMGSEQKLSEGFSEMYAQGLQSGQALRNIVLNPADHAAYKNLDASKIAFQASFDEMSKIADEPTIVSSLATISALKKSRDDIIQTVLAQVQTDSRAAALLLKDDETVAWRKLRAELVSQRQLARNRARDSHEIAEIRGRSVIIIAIVLGLLAIGVACALGFAVRRNVSRELGGEPSDARDALRSIAAGDLSSIIPVTKHDGSLISELATMQEQLRQLVDQIRRASTTIQAASSEVANGNLDLSTRTEEAATSLQETAASMEEIASNVAHTATSAENTAKLAASASEVAQRGCNAVASVVTTMDEIRATSQKVSDIIAVIDGIAFQTNILALNAAVEAARAGEEGRGFAVVAGEVRQLAQRSAQAAKEIKSLITQNVTSVEHGAGSVRNAGETMSEVMESVSRVSLLVSEISA
ncbi:MAG: methyl-accepting chemotaxis protein, partial [Janthinobacterium lividum]